jgi:hypothetical protein
LQNKDLSDDTDALLAMQGIGWLTRKVHFPLSAQKPPRIPAPRKKYYNQKGIFMILLSDLYSLIFF